ncbi:unknown protein [Microcystis viridis NIES-102]|uniref:Uncharacterized protein n=1 Tax=Microcystis viridis NIES-102 TaxID=213615 RepID=A0A3G9JWP1_MICVR|nr:hypothetical protein [Microcystis viridis]BBH39089.1 unknown protein [Microcystis viridis NIES-102]
MKPLYRKTLLRFLPIVFNLERANQLSLLPDKDLADLCPLIEPYQVTKNQKSPAKNNDLIYFCELDSSNKLNCR